MIADRETLALLTGAHGPDLDRAAEVLAAGGVVIGFDRYLVDGEVTLVVENGTADENDPAAQPRITVPGHVLTTGVRPVNSLISPGAVAAAKLSAQPGGLVAIPTTGKPSQAEEDRLSAALADIGQISLSQSGMIAGLGSVLGIAAGLGAAFAVIYAFNQAAVDSWPLEPPYPLSVPWESLLIVAVVPLVAMLGAGLLTRSRLPIERRLG